MSFTNPQEKSCRRSACLRPRFSGRQLYLALALSLVATGQSSRAGNVLWSSPGGSAWLTGSNWTGGSVPGSADNAQFGANPTSGSTGIGINMNTASFVQQVGAIEITSGRNVNLLIGNSSTTAGAAGTLQLNGATVNSVANVIVRNAGAGANAAEYPRQRK